jgi:predicted signal transduction protein with EAL and GGDEF domain
LTSVAGPRRCSRAALTDAQVANSASVGIAVGSIGELDGDALLQRADRAMYAAKARGKGQYEILWPSGAR